MNKEKMVSLLIGAVIFIGTILFVSVLMGNTRKESEVVFYETSFEVLGQYGEEFQYEDLSLLQLKDTIPDRMTKTNGASLGEIRKGHYTVDGLGKCMLYVHSSKGPYVYFKWKDQYVIINFPDASKTAQLYADLSEKLSS